MRILEIRNFKRKDKPQAWLLYDPDTETFQIEIQAEADPWKLPASLFGWAMQKKYTLNSKESLQFVQERIIPAERQNIISILNGRVYREWDMLAVNQGRCVQDDFELIPVHFDDLPEEIKRRI